MSNSRRKICVVTGSRAEYGLLFWLLKELQKNSEVELQLVVTGMHLSPEFGLTYQEIISDGFVIDAKIEMLVSSDTPVGIAKSIGLGIIGFADTLNSLRPDIFVILGDRFETIAAAQAATVIPIPIAHIGGGDYGEATHDNITRHCLTKMSHIHFVTHSKARHRVIQLGEDPRNVHNVGSLAVDASLHLRLLDEKSLSDQLAIEFKRPTLLVTFHPTNLETETPAQHFADVIKALEDWILLGATIVFTMPNADNDGRIVRRMIQEFCATHPSSFAFESLGQHKYLSLLKLSDAVVGNSSSGIYEAPLYKTPTVDIGNRQRGREHGSSVIHVEPEHAAISEGTRFVLENEFNYSDYPYGQEGAARRMTEILKQVNLKQIVYKRFLDIGP